MQKVLWSLVVLLFLGWYATQVHVALPEVEPHETQLLADDKWRRTVNGWETIDAWTPAEVERYAPQLHPLVVAAAVLLLSLLMLVLFADDSLPDDAHQVSPTLLSKLAGRRTADLRL